MKKLPSSTLQRRRFASAHAGNSLPAGDRCDRAGESPATPGLPAHVLLLGNGYFKAFRRNRPPEVVKTVRFAALFFQPEAIDRAVRRLNLAGIAVTPKPVNVIVDGHSVVEVGR